MTPVVLQIIVANVLMFFAQQWAGDRLIVDLALWPVGHFDVDGFKAGFQIWQLFTYAFLHADAMHIALNMFAVYMFGRDVEILLGARQFLRLYVASILAAGLVQLAVVTMNLDEGIIPTLGASGGVFGILLAFGVSFPKRRVMLLIPPIPMPAWVLVTGYGVVELAQGVFGTQQGVAHFAHLGGMLGAGLVLFLSHANSQKRFPRP